MTAPHPHPAGRADAATAARPGQPYVSASPLPGSSPHRRHHAARKKTPHHRAARHRHSPSPGHPRTMSAGHVFVGVAVKGPIEPAVQSFSQATGVHMALVELYGSFGGAFPQLEASRVTALGSTPFLQWNPRHAPVGQIAAGKYDTYVRQYAQAVKAFGHSVVLSFGHEMNGSWNRWGAGHARPAKFVAAWRRIHTIFARQHVPNVSWSWDPSHTAAAPGPWWPGAAYVDRIGIDGYQRSGQTFADIFASRLAYIRSFTSKPIFIAETSVAPGPGQAGQIRGLFDGVRQYHLSGFVWFDIDHLEPWRLEGRPTAVRAFRRSVAQMK
jgi:Glycosyl hydrolase family 26